MTTRNLGYEDNKFIAQVMSVDDTDEEGKLQLKPIDWTDIPKEDLPWGKPLLGLNNAGQNKIGSIPVGAVVGSWVTGYWLDPLEKNIPIIVSTLASAGEPKSDGTTKNGQLELVDGTNGFSPGGRTKTTPDKKPTNKFVTRKGKSIKDDDHSEKTPTVQKDNDAVDVTAEAKANTSFGTNGTTGSINNPIGSILSQIASIDPKNLNAVLPNAVSAFQAMQDLNIFSSTNGINGILGQVLGQVLNSIGLGTALEALGTTLDIAQLSSSSISVIKNALASLGSIPSFSQVVQSIIDPVINQMTEQLSSLIENGLNSSSFNSLISNFQSIIQNTGAEALLGVNINNILSSLESVLPTISSAINSVINTHISDSVLDQNKMNQVLQGFSMNQAFVKKPEKGKKALAKKATDTVSTKAAANVKDLPLTPAAKDTITNITAYNG